MAEGKDRTHERLVSIECAHCGAVTAYRGSGRRPRYCSPTCRTRAWELRRATTRLERDDPRPTVVREVVERHTERTVSVLTRPRSVEDWVRLLGQLEHQVRTNPLSLVHSDHELHDLAHAVDALYGAFVGDTPHPADTAPDAPSSTPDPTVADPAQLSRQQRRAQERTRRKRR